MCPRQSRSNRAAGRDSTTAQLGAFADKWFENPAHQRNGSPSDRSPADLPCNPGSQSQTKQSPPTATACFLFPTLEYVHPRRKQKPYFYLERSRAFDRRTARARSATSASARRQNLPIRRRPSPISDL